MESTEKGDAAKKYVNPSHDLVTNWPHVLPTRRTDKRVKIRVRDEESVPDLVLSDEGREVSYPWKVP